MMGSPEHDRRVSGNVLVFTLVALALSVPAPTNAEEPSPANEEATPTEPASVTAPARGSAGIEALTGTGGFVLGGFVVGVPSLFLGDALFDNTANTGTIAVASTGLGVGAILGAGTGSYLGGNWSGGNGRLGWSLIGSTAGALGAGAGFGLLGLAFAAGATPVGTVLIVASPFAAAFGSVAGGVVGYRHSARPVESQTGRRGPRIRPIVAPSPRAETGLLGVSVDF